MWGPYNLLFNWYYRPFPQRESCCSNKQTTRLHVLLNCSYALIAMCVMHRDTFTCTTNPNKALGLTHPPTGLTSTVSHNDTINANCCHQMLQKLHISSRKNITANLLSASFCCMTSPVLLWPTELTANRISSDGRCSSILYRARTYHHIISTSLDL